MGRLATNYAGIKINYLTGIEKTGHNVHGHVLWKFRCECGNEKNLNPNDVRTGKIKSCGCMQWKLIDQKKRLPDGEGSFRGLLRSYIKGAKQRNIVFELSDDEFRTITKQNCFYCQRPPERQFKIKDLNTQPYIYNGIDRVDNSIGYIFENCVPCCWDCNNMKGSMDYSKFLNQIEIIFKNRNLYK